MRNLRFPIFAAALLALFVTVSARAGIRVVSDIDDTAKISNVGDPISLVINGMFSRRAFVGMRELYSSLAIGRGYAFDYVTGTPEVLRYRAKKFLRAGGFPGGDLYLKPTFGSESLREYKTRVIRSILDAHPDDQFIFVGDDTQVDFQVYDDLFRYAPDRIVAIYIRKVTNRKLPPSAYPFLTAFDIARTEHLMGRMLVEEASPVAIAILAERKDSRIVPRFSYCPVSLFFVSDPRIEKWNQDIDARVQKICRARNLSSE